MFNLGFSEIVVLAVIGLLVLGPEQLPVVARKVARMINDFKRATEEAMSPVDDLKHQARNFMEKTRETAQKFDQQQQEQKIDSAHHGPPDPGPVLVDEQDPNQLELTAQNVDPEKKDV